MCEEKLLKLLEELDGEDINTVVKQMEEEEVRELTFDKLVKNIRPLGNSGLELLDQLILLWTKLTSGMLYIYYVREPCIFVCRLK